MTTRKPMYFKTLLSPPATTLIKLGSLIIHYQEWTSQSGDIHDKIAIDVLETDPEITAWLSGMTKAAFLPLKR